MVDAPESRGQAYPLEVSKIPTTASISPAATSPGYPDHEVLPTNVCGQPYSVQIRSHVTESGHRSPASSCRYSRTLTPRRSLALANPQRSRSRRSISGNAAMTRRRPGELGPSSPGNPEGSDLLPWVPPASSGANSERVNR